MEIRKDAKKKCIVYLSKLYTRIEEAEYDIVRLEKLSERESLDKIARHYVFEPYCSVEDVDYETSGDAIAQIKAYVKGTEIEILKLESMLRTVFKEEDEMIKLKISQETTVSISPDNVKKFLNEMSSQDISGDIRELVNKNFERLLNL
jgi:hypothetical protein